MYIYVSACGLISSVLVSVGHKFKIYIGKNSDVTSKMNFHPIVE